MVGDPGRAGGQRLQRRVLAVENAQRIRGEPAPRILVKHGVMAGEVSDQRVAVFAPLKRIAQRIDVEHDAAQAQRLPQPREHDDLLGIDVGSFEAEGFDVELMELAIAAFLRPLVPEHRAARPYPERPVVSQVVLDRRANDAGGGLGPERQRLAVQLVLERVHLPLDDVSGVADAALEQRGRLHDRDAQIAIPVLREYAARSILETLPQR